MNFVCALLLLGATGDGLYLPAGTGKVSAVVMAAVPPPGSGIDWLFDGFRDHLVRRGVAVKVVTMKNGTSFSQHLTDVAAAAEDLRKHARVRPDLVGLWGFSSGSIASIAAAPKANAAFVILVSGPAVSRVTRDLDALGPALKTKGFDDAAVEEARTLMRQLWSYYATGAGWETVRPLVEAAEKKPWFAGIEDLARGVAPPRYLAEHPEVFDSYRTERVVNPAEAVGSLNVPVLVLYGANDRIFDVKAYRSTFRKHGGAKVRVAIVEDADHFLRSGEMTTPHPDTLEALDQWLSEVAGSPKTTSGRKM